jgi:hypothetical protein
MTRIAALFGLPAGCFAVLACAFGLATARATHANGTAAPDAHADCAPPGARSHGATIAQRPRAVSRSRPLSHGTPVALGAPSPTRSGGRAGLVIDVDPLGGEASLTTQAEGPLHPDADPAFTRSTEGLVLEINPDGSRRVNLEGRFRAYSVATIAADGSITMACTDDHASAIGLARAAAPRPPAPRVAFGPREE